MQWKIEKKILSKVNKQMGDFLKTELKYSQRMERISELKRFLFT